MLRRVFNIRSVDVAQINDDDSIRIAMSTENPYLRGRINGHRAAYEVLGHKSNEVILENILEGAPFLFEHKTDNQIGGLRNVTLDKDNVLRADVVFSRSQFAQDILDDIKRGIRTGISVGYEVLKYEDVGERDGIPVVRATSWAPHEASIVSMPADRMAGIGKSRRAKRYTKDGPVFITNDTEEVVEIILPDGTSITDPAEIAAFMTQYIADSTTTPTEDVAAPAVAEDNKVVTEEEVAEETEEAPVEAATEDATGVETEDETEEEDEEAVAVAAKTGKSLFISTQAPAANNKETLQMSKNTGSDGASKDTIKTLTALAVRHNMTDKLADWISEGKSVESIKAEILDTRSNDKEIIGAPALHLNKTEKTMDGAVRAFLRGDNSELAEMGVDAARHFGRSINPGVLYLPVDVPMIVRTGTGVTNTGVSGVGKNYMSYIESLREGSTFAKVGGNIETFNDITSRPYFATTASAAMYHESGSSNDKEVTVGTRTWNPKRASARYLYQNTMGRLNGTYDFEAELLKELNAEGVRIVDQQVWAGAGTGNEITGLVNDSNITLLTHTGSFTVLNASTMWSTVAAVNGINDGQFTFVVAPAVKGQALSSGSFGAGSGVSVYSQIVESIGPVFSSNYLGAGTIASSYAAIAGDMSKATLGLFGPVEVTRDPYTLLQTGQSVLQLDAYIDAVAWQPGSFVRWKTNTI